MARWNDVVVDERKILDYLLASDHPVGGGKAAYFLSIGYSRETWQQLRTDLTAIAQEGDLVSTTETPFGVKIVIDGAAASPSGKRIALRTVWITDHPGTDALRLVTAYLRDKGR
ncbi:MAG: hypothetical protein LLG14_21665 [Nocardiaceae bacterium]|nr:hypothetical protein [Nocardiaceae bacterium]